MQEQSLTFPESLFSAAKLFRLRDSAKLDWNILLQQTLIKE